MITGTTALQVDLSRHLGHRMAWFLGIVIGLSFLLLMLVFKSVLIPLKAAVFNLLSVGASYGAVVAVFQWGWGASLIGVHEKLPIMPLAPMLMFAILFGLSMDYACPRQPDPGAVPSHRGRPRSHRRGSGLDRPRNHERCPDHDRRVRRVHPGQ